MEIKPIGRAWRKALMIGTTREISSPTATGSAPGRVDSPPMSSHVAQASHIARPILTASSTVDVLLLEWNESGVALMTPISRHVPPSGRLNPSAISIRRSELGPKVPSMFVAMVAELISCDREAFLCRKGLPVVMMSTPPK